MFIVPERLCKEFECTTIMMLPQSTTNHYTAATTTTTSSSRILAVVIWLLVATGSHAFTAQLKIKSVVSTVPVHADVGRRMRFCFRLHASRSEMKTAPSSTNTNTRTRTNHAMKSKFTNDHDDNKVSKYLVDALDLYPLLENVARYTGTKRGRDALLYLVSHDEDTRGGGRGFLATRNYEASKRKAMLSSMTASSSSSSFSANVDRNGNLYVRRNSLRHIIQIANSSSEAREEWSRIQEAMNILEAQESMNHPSISSSSQSRRRRNISSKSSNSNSNSKQIPLPPIYAADSSTPFQNAAACNEDDGAVETDDDEWLQQILAGFGGKLELEHILQADQIVNRILRTFEWAGAGTKVFCKSAPNIAAIFDSSGIDVEALEQLHSEIKGTVKIAKGGTNPTMTTPRRNGNAYIFQMNEDKFPSLSILRKKERNLVRKMNDIVQGLLDNKKYLSQLSGFTRKKPEPYELDGRIVVAASKDVAKRIGIIRGHSSTSASFCFVEPREVVSIGNELKSIREEINTVVNEISEHLSSIIIRSASAIDRGLDVVARVDVIFARAAFGCTLNGFVPYVGTDGVIDVSQFIHPVLATRGASGGGAGRKTTPIDLKLALDDTNRSLIISGPNGGGKSLAMKSFAVVGMMNKLGIPIPRNDYGSANIDTNYYNEDLTMSTRTRVDFFDEILVEIGDSQNLMDGESTYMAQMNSLAALLHRVEQSSGQRNEELDSDKTDKKDPHFLILLDELGGGTDPTAGSCIAQAILEKIFENENTRTIVTTHSTQLKALSVDDERIASASVLLQTSSADGSRFRLPTYKLCYGTIGNSYALGAASRASPSLPDDVLDRAASLIADSQDNSGVYLRAITEALEKEKEALSIATEVTDGYRDDIIRCRDAMISLSRSYDQHLSRIEDRLDRMLQLLKDDETKNAYEIVGDTLSTLKLSRKQNKSKEEMLRDKGMRVVSINDKLLAGESVVVIGKEYEGESAVVSMDQSEAEFDEIMIDIDFEYGLSLEDSKLTLRMKRKDVAIWDYPTMDDGDWNTSNYAMETTRSIPDSRNNLLNLLGSLKTADEKTNSTVPKMKKGGNSKFSSSRQRKAAGKKANSKKKKKRK